VFIVNAAIHISDAEFQWSYVRSSGPGGQNVNKVASKAVLRWNVVANTTIPAGIKGRFVQQQGGRISTEGDLILTSQRYRDQERNRQDCLDKLRELLLQAATRPKPRRPTRPTRGSREARLKEKRRRAMVKSQRRRPGDE
jgi:ribosome-associated protein